VLEVHAGDEIHLYLMNPRAANDRIVRANTQLHRVTAWGSVQQSGLDSRFASGSRSIWRTPASRAGSSRSPSLTPRSPLERGRYAQRPNETRVVGLGRRLSRRDAISGQGVERPLRGTSARRGQGQSAGPGLDLARRSEDAARACRMVRLQALACCAVPGGGLGRLTHRKADPVDNAGGRHVSGS
jgi:hypothetical protein